MFQAHYILNKYWQYTGFRPPQEEIISAVLEKNDILALLPTGAGKSLCYQIPGMILPGITLVVSPLIALMEDQLLQLKQRGIKALSLAGNLHQSELIKLLDNAQYAEYKFLYLSPERLKQSLVLERLQQLPISLIAIDEAHCLSQWGHDFRPAYLEVGKLRNLFPKISCIALTATTNAKIKSDIINILQLENAQVFTKSYFREEIELNVSITDNTESELFKLLKNDSKSVIIYLRSRKKTVEIATNLNAYGFSADFFHGGLSSLEKSKKLQLWLKNSTRIMVATNAFGMGIDKEDVSQVIHLQLPDSIESYYQEAGRAGRNQQKAKATLLLNHSELKNSQYILEQNYLDKNFITKVYKHFVNYHYIAIGEGIGQSYQFNFKDFCQKYNLGVNKTYQTFLFFERQGILSFINHSTKKQSLQFLVSSHEIITYTQSRLKEEAVFSVLIHQYNGLNLIPTKINLQQIAQKSSVNVAEVEKILKKWHAQKLVNYQDGSNDSFVIMHQIRDDERTINGTLKHLKTENQNKQQQHRAILDYATNTQKCKHKIILDYFEEYDFDVCGQCSVCIEKQWKKTQSSVDVLKNELLNELANPKMLDELLLTNNNAKSTIIETLRFLLEENKITFKNNHFQKISFNE